MEQIVTGCNGCVLATVYPLEDDNIIGICQHPKMNHLDDKELDITNNLFQIRTKPDWCPLKQEELIIKLKE